MARDPRYDILFEPVRIGPKTARNRFYQVPHCNGMGRNYPAALAEMRGIKAEGGWAVVSTEEVEIHYTGDATPYNEGRLWDDRDMPYHQRVVERIQAHGSLAAIELVHQGLVGNARLTREPSLGPGCRPVQAVDPLHARAMDKQDIRNFRRWHRQAAIRARNCGYDLIYVYCGHDLTLQMHFLSRRYNDRIDEYGGSLENRVRLFRETLEDTLDAVGDRCAVPVRFAVDELLGEDGISCENEGRDVVGMLAEMPDLWDVNISRWENDSQTSRFADEGFQEPFISFVKGMTTKPVVGVGRYTSPDRMVSLVKKGVMDMIGAARPSIADPFLPKKIEEGRMEDIRECIGCNLCVIGDHLMAPMRCTQNATMGEEWRRGWHPEKFARKKNDDRVLVVGAGPAGLEATRVLGERGVEVVLAEGSREPGGRVAQESRLPGLGAWGRVRDYRMGQIESMANVQVFLDSQMDADTIMEFAADHVAIATGAVWRGDGIGRSNHFPVAGTEAAHVYTATDILAGKQIEGPVVVFDDDCYYLGGVIAEKLLKDGLDVTILTTHTDISSFTHNSLEQHAIQSHLLEIGVRIVTCRNLGAVESGSVTTTCIYTGRVEKQEARSVVLVTAMLPRLAVYNDLMLRDHERTDAGIRSVTCIGDAHGPSIIGAAVWSGHRFARDLGEQPVGGPDMDGVPFRREITEIVEDFPVLK